MIIVRNSKQWPGLFSLGGTESGELDHQIFLVRSLGTTNSLY